jgi:hypothetical protein
MSHLWTTNTNSNLSCLWTHLLCAPPIWHSLLIALHWCLIFSRNIFLSSYLDCQCNSLPISKKHALLSTLQCKMFFSDTDIRIMTLIVRQGLFLSVYHRKNNCKLWTYKDNKKNGCLLIWFHWIFTMNQHCWHTYRRYRPCSERAQAIESQMNKGYSRRYNSNTNSENCTLEQFYYTVCGEVII